MKRYSVFSLGVMFFKSFWKNPPENLELEPMKQKGKGLLPSSPEP